MLTVGRNKILMKKAISWNRAGGEKMMVLLCLVYGWLFAD